MEKKLCILLIFIKLDVLKHLIYIYCMHNLYAIFAKYLDICKQKAGNLVNEQGNVPRPGAVPGFSDLEVVALGMASEAVGIGSEPRLFSQLCDQFMLIRNYEKDNDGLFFPISGKSAHLQSYNILTAKTTSPLAESSMR